MALFYLLEFAPSERSNTHGDTVLPIIIYFLHRSVRRLNIMKNWLYYIKYSILNY
jgi:hypothetical protein